MSTSNFLLRITKKEKSILKILADENSTSMNDYIRHRLFINNHDLSESETIFESPKTHKHNYLTARVLQDVYMMLLQIVTEDKNAEEAMEIKSRCRDHAERNISKFGYLKIEQKSKEGNNE